MIVATAGHIDHGKTLLVKVLTGVDTDRLPEEKARGISIDLGFAYLPLAGGGLVGFVDVPGHERFVHNMLAGVCGIDFALLAVAADDGVMPQTVEHVHILHLLGVRQGIAAITKADRVAPTRVAEVSAQLRALLAGTALEDVVTLPVSALTGEGIDALRQVLQDAARARAARGSDGQNFRLAVDRAFTVAGSGTVVTGTVFSGEAKPGDRLVLSPSGTPVRVRGVQIRGAPVPRAQAGERCALNLLGADVDAAGRGNWVLHEAIHAPTRQIDVRLSVLRTERNALAHWSPVHVHLGTCAVTARVAVGQGRSVSPGESALVQLVLDAPIGALHGDRFIVRDQSARRTLGGGTVIDPFAQRGGRSAPARLATLAALEQATPEAALTELLRIPNRTTDCAGFSTTFNLRGERAAALYRSPDVAVLGRERRVAVSAQTAAELCEALLARLAAFHRDQPLAEGMELQALHRECAAWLPADAFQFLLRGLSDAGKIAVRSSTALLAGHSASADPAEQEMWNRVLPALLEGGFAPPRLAELAERLRFDVAALETLLHRKSKNREVMRIDQRFYPRATLATLAANAALVARSSSKGLFTAAQYRDATGIGRTLCIKILELFDTFGITQRVGDARRMRNNFVPILGPAKPLLAPGAKRGAGNGVAA